MGEIERLRLRIVDVSCAKYIVPIRKKLEKTDDIKFVGSNYITDFLYVNYDSKIITKTEIIQNIKNFG